MEKAGEMGKPRLFVETALDVGRIEKELGELKVRRRRR